jgi:hypothetical protein
MPRFVLLRHETPTGYVRPSHWDLMFETGAALRTWALEQLPTDGAAVLAEELPAHRLAYLDYEGPVSGDRGEVRREDAGLYELLHETADEFTARMMGRQWQGIVSLVRHAEETWELRLRSDV